MANTTQKSVILITVFLISCTSVILMAVSFGTECWLTETTPVAIGGYTNATTSGEKSSTLGHSSNSAQPALIGGALIAGNNDKASLGSNSTTLSGIGTASFSSSGISTSPVSSSAVNTTTDSSINISRASSSVSSSGMTTTSISSTLSSATSHTVPPPSRAFAQSAKQLTAVPTIITIPGIGDGYAKINLGLFTGFVNFDVFIQSSCSFTVFQSCVLNKGLYVVAVIFYILAVLLGITSAVFSAINSTITPIEEITGLTGLYVWNGLAAVFDLVGILCYVGVYYSDLVNIRFINNAMCSSKNTAELFDSTSLFGYSFYIPIGVFFLFVINVGLVNLTTKSLSINKNQPPVEFRDDDDHNQGVIMLF